MENVFLQNNSLLKISNYSLIGLKNIENIYISIEFLNEYSNVISLKNSLSPLLNKIVNHRKYYQAIYVTAFDANNSAYQEKFECFFVLYFIKYKIHLNLKTDYELFEYLRLCYDLELFTSYNYKH